MKTQIKQKPIFIAVINQEVCRENASIKIADFWYSAIEPHHEKCIIDTSNLKLEDFKDRLSATVGVYRPSVCIYLCMHGEQHKDYESLLLNKKVSFKDIDFSNLINSFKIDNLFMFNEVCHSGGLIDFIKLDTQLRVTTSKILIFNTSNKDDKSALITDGKTSVGLSSRILYTTRINPFLRPKLAYETLKKYKRTAKVTILENLI